MVQDKVMFEKDGYRITLLSDGNWQLASRKVYVDKKTGKEKEVWKDQTYYATLEACAETLVRRLAGDSARDLREYVKALRLLHDELKEMLQV